MTETEAPVVEVVFSHGGKRDRWRWKLVEIKDGKPKTVAMSTIYGWEALEDCKAAWNGLCGKMQRFGVHQRIER